MLVALLLLAAPGPFDTVFDPASPAAVVDRKTMFNAAVKKRGIGAAIRSFKGFEKGMEQAAEAVDKGYARYKKAADAYWAYRRKTGANARAVPESSGRSRCNSCSETLQVRYFHSRNLRWTSGRAMI